MKVRFAGVPSCRRLGIFAALLLALALPLLALSLPQNAVRAAAPAARVWLAADGATPLPFKTDDELIHFLRNAKVKKVKNLSVGITGPQQVLLELNGVQAHAHFNYAEMEKSVATFKDGKREMGFRDSHVFQSAAYELARIMGLDNVPPAVPRTIRGSDGTLTAWVENSFTERDRVKKNLAPPRPQVWVRQKQNMHVWDNLIANVDRNQGNILFDANWKIWFIDHTRAFRRYEDLEESLPEFQMCGRKMLQSLRDLNEAEVRQRLRPYLRGVEIDAILKRRALILAKIEALVREKGEGPVLFNEDW